MTENNKIKAKFSCYYKYVFTYKDEQGNLYCNFGDHSDIYRFQALPEIELEEIDGKYYYDGLEFDKIPQ